MRKPINNSITCSIFLLFLSVSSYGQKNDSLAIIREFMQVCNVYKQLPLYLDVDFKSSTNFITDEQDTSFANVNFYIQDHVSYTRFGEVEQLIDDSLALVVSDKMKQMFLSSNGQTVFERMKTMTGAPVVDSAVTEITKKYKSEKKISGENVIIELANRDLIYGTSLPKESITIEYNAKTKLPVKVETMRRVLLPLQESDYKLLQESAIKDKLLTVEDNRFFLIKEQSTQYVYKEIDHSARRKLPALITDRVVKNTEGNFEPVKKYESYRLTTN